MPADLPRRARSAGLLLTVLLTAACTSGPVPHAAGPATTTARTAPGTTTPHTTTPGTTTPGTATPGTTTPGTPPGRVIALADPRAGTVAGAQLGRAAPVPGAAIAGFPEPTGAGARPRHGLPPVIGHGPRDRRRIALTFDSNMTDSMLRRLADGRVASYASPAVVDELQKSHTPATFFLAGKWVEAYPALTRRIAADPDFELANHSWSHEGFRPGCYTLGRIPAADMAADVERSFQLLDAYSAHASRFFRFPGGCYDPAALAAIAPTGCTVVEYDDVSGDAFGSNPATIEAATLRQARPGSIVVLHITGANSRFTSAALPGIIRGLRAQGYQLVTLGELLAPGAGPAGRRPT